MIVVSDTGPINYLVLIGEISILPCLYSRLLIPRALTVDARLVLLDEKKGRAAAKSQSLRVVGTLGILAQAAAQDLLSLPDAVAKLRLTSFQISESLLAGVLAHDHSRFG